MRAVEAMLARFENESHARGKLALDVLEAQERDMLQQERRDLRARIIRRFGHVAGGRQFPEHLCRSGYAISLWLRRSIDRKSLRDHDDEQLCALPVKDCALPVARLFIWSTVPQLANTFKIAAAWGFADYSSHMVWDKTSPDHPDHGGPGTFSSTSTNCCFISNAATRQGRHAAPKRFRFIAKLNASTRVSRIISAR